MACAIIREGFVVWFFKCVFLFVCLFLGVATLLHFVVFTKPPLILVAVSSIDFIASNGSPREQ